MDTVTLVRSAVRGLLKAAGADPGLAAELRGVLHRDDDYAGAGKPACDWDDEAAREALVDALARDARAVLRVLDGREPGPAVTQAAALLAAVTGQDLEEGPGGVFRIARRVAPDRVLPAVGPQARHGHKTAARGFDGYKGHVAVDPDAEIITATAVTPGNSGDAEAAAGLLADLLPGGRDAAAGGTAGEADAPDCDGEPAVYGDAACGPGELIGQLDDAGIRNGIKCQPPAAVTGHFPKDQFAVDLETGTVTCPAGVTAPIRPSRHKRHAGAARFGTACRTCPLAAQCTKSRQGRTITIGPHEARLAAARARQHDPAWKADYTATRPKAERKIGHLMRRRHGGRRARVRGQARVAADFALLAAAVSLARLAVLGLTRHGGTWTVAAGQEPGTGRARPARRRTSQRLSRPAPPRHPVPRLPSQPATAAPAVRPTPPPASPRVRVTQETSPLTPAF
jgi:Transposase DDE domain